MCSEFLCKRVNRKNSIRLRFSTVLPGNRLTLKRYTQVRETDSP